MNDEKNVSEQKIVFMQNFRREIFFHFKIDSVGNVDRSNFIYYFHSHQFPSLFTGVISQFRFFSVFIFKNIEGPQQFYFDR